ncbi:hypothetical protein CJI59_16725 [Streptomyces sp. Alain-F2R5]|nr:hypothetical protein [Streptomyces sp. Alain-F2R5]PAN00529.1 hypothetical protein CJI59_16725 [Streptomyces sp. Alain-F2R5]
MTALDDYFVGYGPEQIEDIKVHERPDGSAVIETVTYKPIRVFLKTPSGLVELHGEDADRALEAFRAEYEQINETDNANGENNR